MKLCPRFKIYRCPSYEVPAKCNLMGNCRFRKNVANCDRWPGYRGGQLNSFHCFSPRSQWPRGMGLDHRGFQSRLRHGCLPSSIYHHHSIVTLKSTPEVSSLWFANPLGVRKSFQGVRGECQHCCIFCVQNSIRWWVVWCLLPQHVFYKKNTSVPCSLTGTINV
jgi:hypothetical protein